MSDCKTFIFDSVRRFKSMRKYRHGFESLQCELYLILHAYVLKHPDASMFPQTVDLRICKFRIANDCKLPTFESLPRSFVVLL